MRHLGTLIAAIVVAPLAWLLLAVGQERSARAFAGADNGGDLHTGDFVRPLILLAAAGLLLGLLGTLRFSPLGAMVTGIAYTLSNTMLLAAPAGVLKLFSDDASVAGRHVDLVAPIRTGTTMVLGVLLLVAAISVQRWRRWPRPADLVPEPADVQDRPLGTDWLGPAPPNQAAEPDLAVRYTSAPEPYADARSSNTSVDAPYGRW